MQRNNACDIGFVGLGVMGKSLALNLADNDYRIACFDLDNNKIEDAISQDKAESNKQRLFGCSSYTELLKSLKSPRTIILSVPAGKPVDHVCKLLIDAGIDADDIVVDTGNSLWTDSVAREESYRGKFIFFSTAISGGEVGARFGPSLMPSGDPYAWTRIKPMWRAIAAKVDPETGKPIERFEPGNPVKEGEPCTTYIGPVGAGHFVKMVHNGIEYADMQLICEVYDTMKSVLQMSPKEISAVFFKWNKGPLDSYLMEISADILAFDDPETGQPFVDTVLDKAGMKGTGLWTAVSSLQIGSPAQTITQAVFARSLSAMKEERVKANKVLPGPERPNFTDNEKQALIQHLENALYCSKICAYAQGFQLMDAAAKEYGWELDFAEIAKIWRAGCIIRAVFLQSISEAYQNNEHLENLLLDPYFSKQISEFQNSWRQAIGSATLYGVPIPALSSALNYYDAYRSSVLPANLLQGQRDYFGAHTYARIDKPKTQKFHINWSDTPRTQIRTKK